MAGRGNALHAGSVFDGPEAEFFRDVASGETFSRRPDQESVAKRFVFGDGEDNQNLSGADAEDNIFGGAGGDTLCGFDSADYLEGGDAGIPGTPYLIQRLPFDELGMVSPECP